MLDAGCWMLDAGCWMLDAGCWMLDAGCWMLVMSRLEWSGVEAGGGMEVGWLIVRVL